MQKPANLPVFGQAVGNFLALESAIPCIQETLQRPIPCGQNIEFKGLHKKLSGQRKWKFACYVPYDNKVYYFN